MHLLMLTAKGPWNEWVGEIFGKQSNGISFPLGHGWLWKK